MTKQQKNVLKMPQMYYRNDLQTDTKEEFSSQTRYTGLNSVTVTSSYKGGSP